MTTSLRNSLKKRPIARRPPAARVALAASLIAAAVGLGACGGGSPNKSVAGVPRPKDGVSSWVSLFKTATHTRNCADMAKLGFGSPCARNLAINANPDVLRTAEFGPGALVDARVGSGRKTVTFVLVPGCPGKPERCKSSKDRLHWEAITDGKGPSIGTRVRHAALFSDALAALLRGIKTHDCGQVITGAETPPGEPPRRFCQQVFSSPVAAQVRQSSPKVKSFGGTANVQFFAVQLQSGKQTVWRAWPVGYAPTAHCLGAKRLCGYGAFSPSASMPVHG